LVGPCFWICRVKSTGIETASGTDAGRAGISSRTAASLRAALRLQAQGLSDSSDQGKSRSDFLPFRLHHQIQKQGPAECKLGGALFLDLPR
jgi:hypothetical protein